MHKKIFIVGLIAFLFLLLNGGQSLAAGPWRGKIIDVETKEPIEGAVVVAFWSRTWRTPAGDNPYIYEVKEIVTDREGKIEMPSYTPINLLPIISYMKGPEFIIFKPGYGSLRMALGKYLSGEITEIKEMELSGKMYRLSPGVIELPPLRTREERLDAKRPADIFGIEITAKDLPLLYKMITEENKNLGLK